MREVRITLSAALSAALICWTLMGTAPAAAGGWQEAFAATDAGEIRYWWTGQGEVALLLHGNAASGRWFTLLEAPKGYKLIAPDMPGFGGSFRPGVFDIAYYAASCLGLMDSLGVQKAGLLLGHSLGGLVAASMAHSDPGRFGAIILSNAPYLGSSRIDASYFAKAAAYAHDDGLLRAAMQNIAPTLSDENLLNMMFEEARLMDPRGFVENPRLLVTAALTDSMSLFGGPVLFIGCSLDSVIPPSIARHNSSIVEGSEYLEMKGVGHAPMLEAPGRFLEAVMGFLRAKGGS